MISVKDQQKIFNIKWLSRVAKENDSQIAHLANLFLEDLGGIQYVTKSTLLNPDQIFDKAVKNCFWKNAACSWSFLHHSLKETPSSVQSILLQPLFLNSNIQYKKSPLIFPRWIKNKELFICDIIKQNSLKTRNDLVRSVGNYASLTFEHNALINALPAKWVSDMPSFNKDDVIHARSNRLESSDSEKKILNLKNCQIRNCILNCTQTIKHNETFWKRKLGVDISEHYAVATNATKESRLRLLHFKILHNIYPTNILLSKMKVRPSDLCEICQVPDFIEHFFFECSPIRKFWYYVNNIIRSKVDIDIQLNINNILMGITSSEFPSQKRTTLEKVNSIILIGKLCISKFRYGKIKNLSLIFDLEFSLRFGSDSHFTNLSSKLPIT